MPEYINQFNLLKSEQLKMCVNLTKYEIDIGLSSISSLETALSGAYLQCNSCNNHHINTTGCCLLILQGRIKGEDV